MKVESNDAKNTRLSDLLSEATIITLASASAYFIAFMYEAGYFRAFDIPLSLVQVAFSSVLIILLSFSGLLFLLFSIVILISMKWPKSKPLQVKLLRICLVLFFPFCILLLYGWQKRDWITLLIVVMYLLFMEIIWPLVSYRDKKSLREKFVSDEVAYGKGMHQSILGRIRDTLGTLGYALVFTLFFCGSLAHTAGNAKATTQREFFVLNEESEIAIVRLYQEMIIGVHFERETRTIQPEIILRAIKGDNTIQLIREDIGPLLRPKKGRTSN